MIEFMDVNGQKVQFQFDGEAFPEEPEHILVICKHLNYWVLTNHKKRGWEFPGGKVEKGESLKCAARREVWEETGAHLKDLLPLGSYKVTQKNGSFVKKVFLGIVESIEKSEDYHETFGPVFVEEPILLNARFENQYSYIMQDQVIEICLAIIQNKDVSK